MENLNFIKEININPEMDIRIYTSSESNNMFRYYIGYPEKMLPKELVILAETEVYLGIKHTALLDGFYIYPCSILEPSKSPIPMDKIGDSFKWSCQQILSAHKFLSSTKTPSK